MVELHFAGYQPARSVHTRALHALRERTGIRITDNIVSQGRPASDLLTMVESGEIDGCYFSSSYLTARVPELGRFDDPFRAAARSEVFTGLDGEEGNRLAGNISSATGYYVLGWWDNGFRHISNAVRPIRTPADCAGLRLRTLDNAQHQAVFRRLGFQPMFIDVAELPRAVAEGTVDAQENPLTNIVNFNLHAHHKHVSLTGHLIGIALLMMNRARYEALPRKSRSELNSESKAVQQIQRDLAVAEDTGCLELLAKAGATLLPPHDIDLAAFRAAAEK
jgi:C4-dicarboxylate-binding protein DctP